VTGQEFQDLRLTELLNEVLIINRFDTIHIDAEYLNMRGLVPVILFKSLYSSTSDRESSE
jgi:hypothetical protein